MFQGSLEDVKLPDIIQLMSVSGKTGCFVLTRGEEKARIFLENGQIVHGEFGHLKGEDAIYSIAIWTEGQFQFQEGEKSSDHSVTKKNTNILMEVARKLDEWRVLSKKIPTLDHIPEFEPLGNRKVSFNTQQWNVLSKINGVSSITRIAAETNMIAIDVAKLIYGLVANGLVKLRVTPKDEPDPNPLDQTSQRAASSSGGDNQRDALLGKVEQIYQTSKGALGDLAQPVVQRHCSQAVKEIEAGKGLSAVMDAATQIVKAAQILEPDKAKSLAESLKQIIRKS